MKHEMCEECGQPKDYPVSDPWSGTTAWFCQTCEWGEIQDHVESLQMADGLYDEWM